MTVDRRSRREFLQFSAAAALAPGLVLPAHAAADPSRVALVVGNDAYPGAPLANAVNDAKAMAGLLEKAGFGVDLRTNADRGTLADATSPIVTAARSTAPRLPYPNRQEPSTWRTCMWCDPMPVTRFAPHWTQLAFRPRFTIQRRITNNRAWSRSAKAFTCLPASALRLPC